MLPDRVVYHGIAVRPHQKHDVELHADSGRVGETATLVLTILVHVCHVADANGLGRPCIAPLALCVVSKLFMCCDWQGSCDQRVFTLTPATSGMDSTIGGSILVRVPPNAAPQYAAVAWFICTSFERDFISHPDVPNSFGGLTTAVISRY